MIEAIISSVVPSVLTGLLGKAQPGSNRNADDTDSVEPEVTMDDIIRHWGESDAHADINNDGIVDVNDLLMWLQQQASNNPTVASMLDEPRAASGGVTDGLASLGGLLNDALGGDSTAVKDAFPASDGTVPVAMAIPSTESTELAASDIDRAMKTAKRLIDRWQALGLTAPPPGWSDLIDTLPMPTPTRGLVARLIEAAF